MPLSVRYPIHRATLPNGLRVVVSPDPTADVVAVNLWFDVGSRDERPGRTGLAHLFEHLMFEGSANVSSGEHLATIQAVGGTANATTWFDRTNYFETVPTRALDLALWLEADRLASLDLTQHTLDNQRDVVMEEKRQRYDNVPYGDVLPLLISLTFPAGHPYAHPTIGSMADLQAASLDDVRTFFATHYAPDNAVISLVGNVDTSDALDRVASSLGGLAPSDRPARAAAPTLEPLTAGPRAEAHGRVPTEASYLAWRLPARDTPGFDAAEAALAILGDGATSRLHRRLVRHDRVADGAGAAALGLIGGTSLGYAWARALPDVSAEELERAVRDEVSRLIDQGPSESELSRVKAQAEREWLAALASFDTRADLLSEYTTLHDDPDAVNRRLDEIRALTLGQVADAAATWLADHQAATLTYRRAS